jgi:hypothetical protein
MDGFDITTMKRTTTFFQSFLLQQLLRTDTELFQMAHSYRRLGLKFGFREGHVHFLQNLRPNSGISNQQYEPLELQLPLGNIWLYRFLSSALVVEQCDTEHSKETMIQNTILVLTSSFEFIRFLEDQDMFFTKQMNVGTKFYHLINTLLYPEEILQDKRILHHFMELFQLFKKQFQAENITAVKGFFSACNQHSSSSRKRYPTKENRADRDILAVLSATVTSDNLLTSDELKTMENFIADLSSAFLEYGALYEPFIHTVRFFLSPWFPSRLRRITIRKINDLLQRLTTTQEDEDVSYVLLTQAVADNISGGLPISQESPRDPHDFLDDLVSLLKDISGSPRKS